MGTCKTIIPKKNKKFSPERNVSKTKSQNGYLIKDLYQKKKKKRIFIPKSNV